MEQDKFLKSWISSSMSVSDISFGLGEGTVRKS
jgi:hypothetical protein